MNTSYRVILLIALLSLMGTGVAGAWGPTAESSIVTTAARLLAREDGIPLTNLMDDVRRGANVSSAELEELIPNASTNPIEAIGSEMFLLQRIYEGRVDPYLAYRLGVLGRLVARTTSPVADSDAAVQTQYASDVEGAIGRATLRPAQRREVDPRLYFPELLAAIAARREMIEADYAQGVGFAGVASQALSQDVSRSTHAVADVWHTLLSGRAPSASIGDNRVRAYYIGAIQYYTERQHTRETEATYERLAATGLRTPDMQKDIADMFYEAEMFERAMQEYRAVLREQPGRRDVIERMSEYYVRVGEEALEQDRLEQALDAFELASEVAPLSEDVQQHVVSTRQAISQRDQRRQRAEDAVQTAEALEAEAEDLIASDNPAVAMDLLREAKDIFAGVSDEFSQEYRAAQSGFAAVSQRLDQLRSQIMANVQQLSGSGESAAVRARVQANASALAEQALQDLTQAEYDRQMKQLADELTQRLDESR